MFQSPGTPRSARSTARRRGRHKPTYATIIVPPMSPARFFFERQPSQLLTAGDDLALCTPGKWHSCPVPPSRRTSRRRATGDARSVSGTFIPACPAASSISRTSFSCWLNFAWGAKFPDSSFGPLLSMIREYASPLHRLQSESRIQSQGPGERQTFRQSERDSALRRGWSQVSISMRTRWCRNTESALRIWRECPGMSHKIRDRLPSLPVRYRCARDRCCRRWSPQCIEHRAAPIPGPILRL